MSLGIISSHISGTPVQVHAGACSMLAWHIVNRSAEEAFFLVFDLLAANVTLGTTSPFYILAIPGGGQAFLALPNGIGHVTGMTVACVDSRSSANGVDCDAFLQYSY